MTRLLVTGASGLLGLNLALEALQAGDDVTGLVHQQPLEGAPFPVLSADLSSSGQIATLLDQTRPEVIVHCAAMANVDACEAVPDQAGWINTVVPGLLAKETYQRGIRLVHLSTDAVFDGVRGGYTETDTPNPLSVYARTKLGGEEQVAAEDPTAIIARVNFYGWSLNGKRSLAEFFYNNLSAGRQVNGFKDVYFCPLLANSLAKILLEMARKGLAGIYHVVSKECLSKYDFGLLIAHQFGLDAGLIQSVSVLEGGLVARRSPNLTMRCDKLAHDLAYELPSQQQDVQCLYDLSQARYPQMLRSLGGEA